MAESADESTLYVALPDGDAISVIDTATLTETRRISTGPGTEPESLALVGGRLFFSYPVPRTCHAPARFSPGGHKRGHRCASRA